MKNKRRSVQPGGTKHRGRRRLCLAHTYINTRKEGPYMQLELDHDRTETKTIGLKTRVLQLRPSHPPYITRHSTKITIIVIY